MAEIISFNKARKAPQRADKKRVAGVNRVQSGRSTVERLHDATERKKRDEELDDKKLD